MPNILNWARQLVVRSPHSSSEATQAASDCWSDATSAEALGIAAEIRDHQRRRQRNSEVTRQVIDKYRVKSSEGQAIVATTNETTTTPSTPSQDVPRVVPFRATNQDEAISALISSLDRRIGKRLEELNRENAGLNEKITELTGVVADFATKNSELNRTVSRLSTELGNTVASFERASQEKANALETISRLESEAVNQSEAAAKQIAAVEADTRAKIDAVRMELLQKAKGGSKLAWFVAFLVAAAAVATVLLS